MEEPQATSDANASVEEAIQPDGKPFASATFTIDARFAVGCSKRINATRHDSRLRLWIRVFGLIALPAWAIYLILQGNWLGTIFPLLILSYVVFGSHISGYLAIAGIRKAGVLGVSFSYAFYSNGFVCERKDAREFLPWQQVAYALFFHDGLLLQLHNQQFLWLPRHSIDDPLALSEFVRANLNVVSKFQKQWN